MSAEREPRRVLWWTGWRSLLFDLVFMAGITTMTVLIANDAEIVQYQSPQLKTFAMATVPVAALAMLVRRRFPLLVVLVELTVGLIGYDLLLLPVSIYSLGRFGRSERQLLVVSLLVTATITTASQYNPLDVTVDDGVPPTLTWMIITPVLLVGVPALLGIFVRARYRLMDELRERAERLERERHLLAAQALAEERSRIAREMHDVVAHQVGLAVIYSGVLEVSVDQGPDEVRKLARQVGDTNRQALRDLREVIGVLRLAGGTPDDPLTPQPTLDELPELIESSRTAGLPATLRIEGDEAPMSDNVQRTVYRVVQESLSNVHKHAGPMRTEVLVRYTGEQVEVRVRNEPPRQPAPVAIPGGGHGLIGMRERVSLVRGEFAAGPLPDGGFEVNARLPLDPAALPEHDRG
ncbi:sensor histidine kinase [Saccharopolyspora taberi]|uniref:histidine kinase n=1 Tax=Saccharopolyspora taberi TaxID=60895 RepID=A0ABN3VGT0_9PSEU